MTDQQLDDYNEWDAIPLFDDWDPYVKPGRQQDDCGSCYAVASLSMLETRFKIQKNILNYSTDDVSFSIQHMIDCSV